MCVHVCVRERAREKETLLSMSIFLSLCLSYTHMLTGHRCVDNVVAMLSLRDSIAVLRDSIAAQAMARESLITLQKSWIRIWAGPRELLDLRLHHLRL